MERNANIDIMKGIGILLVLYYHSAPHFPMDLTADPIVSTTSFVINTFFMQLFFFCSGFLMIVTDTSIFSTNSNCLLNIESYLQRRFVRLMIPYFTFALISVLLRVFLGTITRSDTSFSDGIINIFMYAKYFWFLFVLFVITILFKILRVITSKWWIWILFGLIMSVISYIRPINLFHFDRICYFSFFVVFGAVFAVFINKLVFLKRNIFLYSFLCLYIIMIYLNNLVNDDIYKYFMRILLSSCAILLIYSLSFKLLKLTRLANILNYFGKYSLQYYLLQDLLCLPIYYCVFMLNFQIPILSVFLIFVLMLGFSFICLHFCIRIPYSYLFLGLKKRNNIV